MTEREETKYFFILYDNGETFYFKVEPNQRIYCIKFKNIYESITEKPMPGAHSVEFIGNSFNLKNAEGKTIYSLEDYNNEMSKILPKQSAEPTIKRIYIDEDVRSELLKAGKIKYDEKASQIPGLLFEEKSEQEVQSKGFSRTRRP